MDKQNITATIKIFIEEILPQGTKRREWYELVTAGIRTLINEGWESFWWKYRLYIKSKQIEKKDKRTLHQKENDILTALAKSKLKHFLSQPTFNLSFPHFKEPIVSIIILTFNKAYLTYQCLESILAHTDIPYEVIIVDNASTDETLSLLKRCKNVIVLKNNENLGFIKGCNQGAAQARGKYLLFLNNDTVVTSGWLSGLVKTIENYYKCGAVGCKLVWPNGKLQEAGSIIWQDGSTLGYGRGDDPWKPEYSYTREVDYCSGACLLVRRDLFQKLRGFDERYVPAYYEDSDLCLGVVKLGYTVVFQPKIVIFHHEFASSSFKKAETFMNTNRSKFREKWSSYLRTKLPPSSQNILLARDKRLGERILFIDDRIPTLYQGSGFPRSYYIIKFLAELGCKLTIFPLQDGTPWQPSTSKFQELGIEVFYGESLDFFHFCKTRVGYYNTVLISRPHNMRKVFHIIKRFFPNAVLIYDSEALFANREILKAKVKRITLSKKNIERMIREEINLMKKADVVISVSENEKRMIQKNGVNNVEVLGHPLTIKESSLTFSERKDILFVGSFLSLDSPNEDAILYFTKEIFPKIWQKLNCHLFIVGINPPDSVKKLSCSTVTVTGYVEDIGEYYKKCRVFVIPHRYAGGIPWKLHEAMSYGIPAVVSKLIASQLGLSDEKEVLIARNKEEFIEKVIKLYLDEQIWYTLQQNAIEYIKENCAPNAIKITLKKIIKKAHKIKKFNKVVKISRSVYHPNNLD